MGSYDVVALDLYEICVTPITTLGISSCSICSAGVGVVSVVRDVVEVERSVGMATKTDTCSFFTR